MLLKFVKTDSGRARAWLRSSLNEHSLERYFHMIINDDSERILQFYEPHAFIIDQERSSMLPQMAAGLNSILFAITIDNEALNFWSTSTPSPSTLLENGATDQDILAPKVKNVTVAVSEKEKRKVTRKKKSSSQVISFDDDEIKATLTKNHVIKHSASAVTNVDKKELERKVHAALKDHNSYRSPSPTMSITYDDVLLESNKGSHDAGEMSPSAADTTSLLSVDTCVGNDDSSVTKLTPMKNSEVGALIPLSHNGQDDVMSDDSMSIKSFGDDQDYASAMSSMMPSMVPTPQPMTSTHHQYHKRQSSVSSVASANGSTLSREDLKHALLSVMERKEELQDQCQSFKRLLEKESASSAGLKQELNDANRKAKDSTDKMQARINSILRENELLKHQLKKYVGAVQKLRDGPQAHETLAQLEGQSRQMEQGQGSNNYVDYHFEASEYEKKLIQVAEMHGELLEFNEHLQKVLQSKDSLIRRLRLDLVDLRGPLPVEETGENDDNISIISEAESNLSSNAAAAASRSLINIWIPSVFLSGSGGNGAHYHVYQVYLRIRDEEWNIYRRYSEFYALHKDLLKKDRLVASFDFPPKKTVGNKAEKFVEDRKKRLQTYLRQIVNLMVQTNPSLQAKPDREQVIMLMPFFAENSHLRSSGGSGSTATSNQRPTVFGQRRRSNLNSDQIIHQLAI